MAADPVLQWASLADQASAATGVPASTLLGLIKVESGGRPGLTSRTGAQGITQFEPSTAASYGVDVTPGHEASQVMGAAKYLVALGYHQDPALALAKYNGGPGNPQPSYAASVLAAAKAYTGFDGTNGAAAATTTGSSSSSDSSGSLVSPQQHSSLVRFGISAALVAAAVAAIAVGLGRSTGIGATVKRAAKTGAKAAVVV